MSRIYVLQAHRLAVAAARMKADVNYLGVADEETANILVQNHVFLRDVWENGEITLRRLQRLYHQLFPGDYLVAEASLGEELLFKALAYAQEAKAKVLLLVRKGESISPVIYGLVYLIINQGGKIPTADRSGGISTADRSGSIPTEDRSAGIATLNQSACMPDATLGGESPSKHPAVLELEPGENAEAAVGAAALCCMNGLDLRRAETFIRRAAEFTKLPWYDEVAYD